MSSKSSNNNLRLKQAKPKASNGNGNGNGKSKMSNGNGSTVTSMSIATSLSRPMNTARTRMTGSDYITTVSLKANATRTERILLTLPVSPSSYPGTRLTQLSNLWERYRVNSFVVRYVPAIPTSIACQLLLYVDTDPLDDPADSNDIDVILRQATAQTGSVQWNAFTPRTVQLANRADDQLYYTGEDYLNQRFTLQGKAFMVQVTDPINFVGDAITDDLLCGAIYIDWDISFQIPQINPIAFAPPVAIGSVQIPADPNTTDDYIISGLVPFGKYALVPTPDFQAPNGPPTNSATSSVYVPNGRNDATTTNSVMISVIIGAGMKVTGTKLWMTAVADAQGRCTIKVSSVVAFTNAGDWRCVIQAIPVDGTPETTVVNQNRIVMKGNTPVVSPPVLKRTNSSVSTKAAGTLVNSKSQLISLLTSILESETPSFNSQSPAFTHLLESLSETSD